jgi:hypothetical protein
LRNRDRANEKEKECRHLSRKTNSMRKAMSEKYLDLQKLMTVTIDF